MGCDRRGEQSINSASFPHLSQLSLAREVEIPDTNYKTGLRQPLVADAIVRRLLSLCESSPRQVEHMRHICPKIQAVHYRLATNRTSPGNPTIKYRRQLGKGSRVFAMSPRECRRCLRGRVNNTSTGITNRCCRGVHRHS